ncbi:AMP-dependent synthetase/ligase [Cinnamomum micranthum f. kanehirae]|uniref:Long-chain-fatty-acid--CoA ligase n=1 Tax=Cinnamomum micranthum f. kanehirae TaxID=337451 RepID=A0A443PSJ4_9MAGN|nr:AMP-dependent synthetase/ligase [Cinnamomum micranthum f. kanehirae]
MVDSTEAAKRRLEAIHGHLIPHAWSYPNQLHPNTTAGEFFIAKGYSVVLPEKLQTGKWNVYRSARFPLKLVSRFPDHPHIGTLHDNFVHAVDTFQDFKYLGTRVRVDGTVGEYKWMTYGEAGTARSAIGSGLIYHGIPKEALNIYYLMEERRVSIFSHQKIFYCLLLEQVACIGIYFINRPEWVIVDHACSAYSYISVPLYDTLGPDAVKYVVNHASVETIFCTSLTLSTLLSFLSEIPTVRVIVVVGSTDENVPSLPSNTGVEIVSYSKLLHQGINNLQQFRPPKPEDIATICYTSGTTGTPKGAVLTHGNLIANVAGSSLSVKCSSADVSISYLPLAHIYERVNQILGAYYGTAVGFYQGDNLKLMDDLAALRPTVFCSVPRLYNRIYSGITNAVKMSGVLRERLFNAAYNAKKQAILNDITPELKADERTAIDLGIQSQSIKKIGPHQKIPDQHSRDPSPIWDKLVFNKIKEKLGGRVRFMGSGASPLSPDVMDFLRICFGGQIAEGYGMTETSCVISSMDEGDMLTGHVGSPNPACEIKLVDVPEMNYTSDDQPYPRGEICVRGPIVFKGYYKDDVQTREVLDVEGWLHTGDIGLWLPEGRLKIIDRSSYSQAASSIVLLKCMCRLVLLNWNPYMYEGYSLGVEAARKKNIFKLAQGEYIAPEKIENVYANCQFIAQCFIYGDSLSSCLVAIVSVDQDVLKAWAASQGIHFEDFKRLCDDSRARAAVLTDMDAVGREAQLRGFEFAKAVTLVPEPFTLENGLLTPTFKIKRPQARAYFAKAISDMYAELSTSDPAPQHLL